MSETERRMGELERERRTKKVEASDDKRGSEEGVGVVSMVAPERTGGGEGGVEKGKSWRSEELVMVDGLKPKGKMRREGRGRGETHRVCLRSGSRIPAPPAGPGCKF